MNQIISSDVEDFVRYFPLKSELKDTTILITGATGLICSTIVRCLSALDSSIRMIAPVRNGTKARAMLEECANVEIMECDLRKVDYDAISGPVDYIIHGAAPTATRYFVEHPVETIDTIVIDTDRLLEFATRRGVKGFVFLSSLEVYGNFTEDIHVSEDMQGLVSLTDVRSSYPLAKRVAENLCCAYAGEYGVPAKIARLTQTTGPGIDRSDNRVIAQFVRCAAEGRDIVLRTEGLSARPYCYTIDAVEAILYILLRGCPATAYNIANPSTYISARNLAEVVRETLNPQISVRIEPDDTIGYPPVSYLNLSTRALESLGWRPRHNLRQILRSLEAYLLDKSK